MWNSDFYLGPWKLALETTRAMADAQAVISMRMGGMMGLWPVAGGEHSRMIREKPRAMIKAVVAMHGAMIEMQTPDQVMRAGLRPISDKVGKNAKRLTARGSKR